MKMDRRQVFGGALAMAGCGSVANGQARARPPGQDIPDSCEAGGPVTAPLQRRFFSNPSISGSGVHHLSPDGRTLAIRDYRTLTFVPLYGGPARSFPLEGPSFGTMGDDGSIAWHDDSRSVWLLRGETARSGFSTGPLACARRWMDGRMELSPPLVDAPGRLDQVRWVAGSGLGIASFDTRGGYYRPELPDAEPSLAVIEAATGRVRSRMSIREDLLAAFGAPPGEIYCFTLGGVVMANGRVRCLVRARALEVGRGGVGGLLLWTEEEAPLVLPEDAMTGAVAFADGGRKLLVRLPLTAEGVIHEHRQPSPPPTPVSGDYAGLYDLESGRWVWRLSGRSTDWGEGKGVAVSVSGRRALIGLPAQCGISSVFGLIDVRTGRTLQRILSPNNGRPVPGFDGERPWMAWAGMFDVYGDAP